MDLGLEQCFRW